MNSLKTILTPATLAIFNVILTLSLLLLFLQFFQDDLVFKRDNINQGQWWRLITGNLVHTNLPHLGMNLAGLWISAFLFAGYISVKSYIFSLLFLIIGVGLGIYFFSPALMWYAGISGALYGLFLIGAVYAILHKDYITGVPLLILIPAKIIWDMIYGGSQSSAELIGVPVATDAHLYGMIAAIPLALAAVFFAGKRSR